MIREMSAAKLAKDGFGALGKAVHQCQAAKRNQAVLLIALPLLGRVPSVSIRSSANQGLLFSSSRKSRVTSLITKDIRDVRGAQL